MIAALVQGELAADPIERTASNGTRFVTASMRVGVGSESVFVGLSTFSELGVDRLLRLRKGSAMAAAGTLEINVWTDREGRERRDWRLTANEVLSIHQARKRRDATEGA